MAKLYLRDVGSHPERDLEVTLFPDGELQFEADNGKYVHLNIAKAGVEELLKFLIKEIRQTKDSAELAKRSTQGVGLQTETSCKNCGHSKSRHETAGGFCKHCNCNEFIESTMPPIR